jgi:hypothetical protein
LRTRPYQRSQKPVPPGLKKIHAMAFSIIISARELLGRHSCGGRPVAARLASDTLCDMKRRGSRNGEARSGPLVPQSASRHHCRAGINGRREPALVVRRSRRSSYRQQEVLKTSLDDKNRDILHWGWISVPRFKVKFSPINGNILATTHGSDVPNPGDRKSVG